MSSQMPSMSSSAVAQRKAGCPQGNRMPSSYSAFHVVGQNRVGCLRNRSRPQECQRIRIRKSRRDEFQCANPIVDIVAHAIGIFICHAFSSTHAQRIELVAFTIAVALRNVGAAAFVDRARTVANAASIQSAHAIVDVVTDAIGIGFGQDMPKASSWLPSQSQSPSRIPSPPHTPHSSNTLPLQSQSPSGMPAPPHTPHSSNCKHEPSSSVAKASKLHASASVQATSSRCTRRLHRCRREQPHLPHTLHTDRRRTHKASCLCLRRTHRCRPMDPCNRTFRPHRRRRHRRRRSKSQCLPHRCRRCHPRRCKIRRRLWLLS